MNMPSSTALALLSLSLIGLAGCASMGEQAARAAPQPVSQTKLLADADQVYVTRIERIARRRGIEVVWVNPPNSVKRDLVARQ